MPVWNIEDSFSLRSAIDRMPLDGIYFTSIYNTRFLFNKGTSEMMIGERLRIVREQKKLSQGDIEKRTGLLRCYISRVENGHTVPAVETLEKLARALEMQLYQLLYDGDQPPALPSNGGGKRSDEWGSVGKDARFLHKLREMLSRMSDNDKMVLLDFVQHLVNRKR
jgi:transcriptional regulator with XRE-family HTH domain